MTIILVCLGLLFLVTQASTEPPPLVITAKDSGKTLRVQVGQRLTVDLKLEGDYAVEAPEFDPFILALLGQTIQSTSGSRGASMQVKYEFEVRKAGETELIIPVRASSERSNQVKPILKIHLVIAPGIGA